MEKNYGVTAVSSLVLAIVCGLLFYFWQGLRGSLGVGFLAYVSVWITFFYLHMMLQRNMQPTVGITMGLVAVQGAVIAVVVCCTWLNSLSLWWEFGAICVFGAIAGLPLGFIHFALWSHNGFIRRLYEDEDDALYRRPPEKDPEPVAEQEGVWPPPPRIPNRDVPRS